MNASRLKRIVELLLERESTIKIQPALTEVTNHLNNLVNSPQDRNLQTQFASALDRLRDLMQQMSASFQPAQVVLLSEIGADKYFIINLADEIASWVQENPISPAV